MTTRSRRGFHRTEDNVRQAIARGWAAICIYSEYNGSHPEYGHGDRWQGFVFAPGVTPPGLTEGNRIFSSHVSRGDWREEEVAARFFAWLNALRRGVDYIETPDNMDRELFGIY